MPRSTFFRRTAAAFIIPRDGGGLLCNSRMKLMFCLHALAGARLE
jgi:hypothetical protein